VSASETFYAPVGQLKAWFARATPGQAVTYATGAALNPKNETVALVAEWIASREVAPVKRRHPVSGELMHQVQRCKLSLLAEDGPKRVRLDEEWRETSEGKIFLELVRAANFGLPCPSNAELAEVAGLRDGIAASDALKKLRAAGRITVNRAGEAMNSSRIVTIVETGKRTVEARS
jgi:hypothetical protein